MNRFRIYITVASMAALASCSKKIAAVGSGETIRVMSYNIHHCNPPSKPEGFIDVDAVANAIAQQKPDVVALQEVDVNTNRSGKINEAEVLARKLKMNFFFAKAINHDGGDYGVAILSKYPMSESNIKRLATNPDTKGEPRVLATALLTMPNGNKIRFGCAHLDAQKTDINRLLQMKGLQEAAATEKRTFIIAGDFNSRPGSLPINALDSAYTRTCETCEFTIPVINPKSTIDYVAFSKTSPVEVISHQVIPERYASDHLPIISVLKLKSK